MYLPIVLTLSEDREGGGVDAVLIPTLSEDLQRDTSENLNSNQLESRLSKCVKFVYGIRRSVWYVPHSNNTGVLSPDVTLYLK